MNEERNWIEVAKELPPDGKEVETIISDYSGGRNQTALKRQRIGGH